MTGQEEIATSSTTPRNDIAREIVVIFWPQYLQYLGFAVLLVTMGMLAYRTWVKKAPSG